MNRPRLILVLIALLSAAHYAAALDVDVSPAITESNFPVIQGTVDIAQQNGDTVDVIVKLTEVGATGAPLMRTADSTDPAAGFRIRSIEPGPNGHAFAWRIEFTTSTIAGLYDVEVTATLDGGTSIDTTQLSILFFIAPGAQGALSASPLQFSFLPGQTGGIVTEVFDKGTGWSNWDARLIPGKNWDPNIGTKALTITRTTPNVIGRTQGHATGSSIPIGEISINLGGGNNEPFDRFAEIEIFPVDDDGVRISPSRRADNLPINHSVIVTVIHLKVFDLIETDFDIEVTSLPGNFVGGHIGENFIYFVPATNPVVQTGGVPENTESQPDIFLVSASFGNPVGFSGLSMVNAVQERLFDRSDGPFRFNTILFGTNTLDDTTDTAGFVEDSGLSDFENAQNRVAQLQFNRDSFLNGLFASSDRETLEALKELLRDLLRFDPENRSSRNALIDVAFYQASLQVVKAKEKVFRGFSQRLFPQDPLRPIISNEIELFEEALALFDSAMEPYFTLWSELIGLPGEEAFPMPFGLEIFKAEAPFRSVNDTGFNAICDPLRLVSATPNCVDDGSSTGMRDLDLIFDIYAQQTQAAVEVLKMRGLRGSTIDELLAAATIRGFENSVEPEFELVASIIPNWRAKLTPAAHTVALFTGFKVGMNNIISLKGFFEGNKNILGFDPNFLLLVQAFPQVGDEIFDTFNQILQFNDPNNSFTTPLGLARDRLQEARDSYFNFRGQEDEMRETFRVQNLEIRNRLALISGADPGPDIDNPNRAYLFPQFNPGGDIHRQQQSVNIAETRILIGNAQGDVLMNSIENEIQIAARAAGISGDIQDIIMRRGQDRMGFQIGIGAAAAIQAANDVVLNVGLAEGGLTKLGFLVFAGIDAAAELVKGTFEGMIELYSAMESAEIEAKNGELDQFIRGKNIQNLMLELQVCSLQGTEAVQERNLERSRMVALDLEKSILEQRMRENNEALVGRFFADPIHRLLFQADTFEAQQAFEVAQRWMFFAVRALEYKWNTPFFFNQGSEAFTADSVFSLRNAEELEGFVAAMVDFDGLMELTRRGDDRFDILSMKEDLLGFIPTDPENNNSVNTFPNPLNPSGPAIEADEAWLNTLRSERDSNGILTLGFSTYRDFGGTFYRGPRFDANGDILDKGTFVDKIIWVKVKLKLDPVSVNSTAINPDFLEGTLTYGGTSFMRRSNPGTFTPTTLSNQELVLRTTNEHTAFPARFWFFDAGDPSSDPPQPQNFRARLGQPAPIKLSMNENTGAPESVDEINVFKEYSVATTGWTLSIQTQDEFGNDLIDLDRINDIDLEFFHNAKDRP